MVRWGRGVRFASGDTFDATDGRERRFSPLGSATQRGSMTHRDGVSANEPSVPDVVLDGEHELLHDCGRGGNDAPGRSDGHRRAMADA
jgi:hypothetical protein